MDKKNEILIVDDHPIVAQGFTQLLENEPDLSVCGSASNVTEARDEIRNKAPDLILLDISLGGQNGLELVKDLAKEQPDLAVLVVSLHDESVYAERSLRAGARGFIMKTEPTEKLLFAIREVLQGRIYISESLKGRILKRMYQPSDVVTNPVDTLSDRELEVFSLIGEGMTTRKISESLNLGIKTVETHKLKIRKKLNLESGNQLTRYAVEWRISNT
jgi:DNA-binding NarL/FixJ family response regulator